MQTNVDSSAWFLFFCILCLDRPIDETISNEQASQWLSGTDANMHPQAGRSGSGGSRAHSSSSAPSSAAAAGVIDINALRAQMAANGGGAKRSGSGGSSGGGSAASGVLTSGAAARRQQANSYDHTLPSELWLSFAICHSWFDVCFFID